MQHVSSHRAIRAALFAVVCVGVAAVLHGMADGCEPSWRGVAVGLPAIWLAAWPALGRERSGLQLTSGLGAAQVGLHYLFAYMCAAGGGVHPATAPTPAMTDMPIPMPGMPSVQATSAHPSGVAMFAAHALAIVICGWWLRQGERDFFALCRIVAALAAAPVHWLSDAIAALYALAHVGTSDDDLPRPVCAVPDDGLRQRRTPLLTSVTFRGPPVLA